MRPSDRPPRSWRQQVAAFTQMLSGDPGAAVERVLRTVGVLRARLLFRDCECAEFVYAAGYVRVVAQGRVQIGPRVQFFQGIVPSEILCWPGADLSIGKNCGFNYGISIEAYSSIQIGARCRFGSMVRIRDAAPDRKAPIVIGEDVWIAHGAIIEPGVTIGDYAVISAGSVVTCDVAARSLAVGNPATSVPVDLITSGRRSAKSAQFP